VFTFNRNEQIAILTLTAILIVGSVISAYDYFWPSDIENFEVRKAAIPVPEIPPETDHPTNVIGLIDLNTATARQLTGLPQVGPKTAERIVTYRATHGAFGQVADLTNVKGIGPKTLEKLRPFIAPLQP
jgi:competence ComEA-like helix-hairpin-helix protein